MRTNRSLGPSSDLGAFGAHVWLDEAELKVGDSLFEKIESALDQVDHLAVIMSPESVGSRRVREELRQALHGRLSGRDIVILPILLRDCAIPGFLRDQLYADFREEASYENALQGLVESLGLSVENLGARKSGIHSQPASDVWRRTTHDHAYDTASTAAGAVISITTTISASDAKQSGHSSLREPRW